jgi:enolase
MMNKPQIIRCSAREILDSRGNPTVEATVLLDDGTVGVAAAPSGASTGIYEAHELRDGDPLRYGGKGVLGAVKNIIKEISPALMGLYATEQAQIDRKMIELDGTENKSRLGANAILSVSLAVARASANWYGMPVFRYLGGANANRLPVPMMNILNGGAHASNNIEIQEFMIVPSGAQNFSEALRICSEITHTLGMILKTDGKTTTVGDEGGFAPDLASDEEAIQLIIQAIEKSGYNTDTVKIALDAASGEWYSEEGWYFLPKRKEKKTREELIDYWETLIGKYPIISLEDALDQRDYTG